jgi:hypothetical protein
MLPCLAPVLFTFKIQGGLKFWKGGRAESVKDSERSIYYTYKILLVRFQNDWFLRPHIPDSKDSETFYESVYDSVYNWISDSHSDLDSDLNHEPNSDSDSDSHSDSHSDYF